FLVRAAPERRKSLEPCDRQQPGGNRGTSLEPISLTPHVQKDFADQVLGLGLLTHETQNEPVHPYTVQSEPHMHGQPIAGGDSRDQHLVRCRLHQPTINRLVAGGYNQVQSSDTLCTSHNQRPIMAPTGRFRRAANIANKFLTNWWALEYPFHFNHLVSSRDKAERSSSNPDRGMQFAQGREHRERRDASGAGIFRRNVFDG